MATLTGTQAFMAEHAGHAMTIEEELLYSDMTVATVYQDNSGTWRARHGGENDPQFATTTGVWLYCNDCGADTQLNLGEFDDE